MWLRGRLHIHVQATSQTFTPSRRAGYFLPLPLLAGVASLAYVVGFLSPRCGGICATCPGCFRRELHACHAQRVTVRVTVRQPGDDGCCLASQPCWLTQHRRLQGLSAMRASKACYTFMQKKQRRNPPRRSRRAEHFTSCPCPCRRGRRPCRTGRWWCTCRSRRGRSGWP